MSLYHFITNRFTKPAIARHEARGREEGREEGIIEGREEGIIEGQEQANRTWSEWNQRRLTHEAQGIPFNEPPPDQQLPPTPIRNPHPSYSPPLSDPPRPAATTNHP